MDDDGRVDDALRLAEELRSDQTLARAASQLGITYDRLRPHPRSAFTRGGDSEEIVDLRLQHHERQRRELAKELRRHVRSIDAQMKRAASAGTLHASSSAALTSGSSSVDLNKTAGDQKRLQMLKQRREVVPKEWFEKKHLEAQRQQERASRRHEEALAAQQEARWQLVENQLRARDRNEAARREEYRQRLQGREQLHERLQRAQEKKERDERLHEQEVQKQRARLQKMALDRSKSLERLQVAEARRVSSLIDRFGRQERVLEHRFSQREQEAAFREERQRLLLEDHYDRQARHHASRMVQAMMVHEKHQAVDERLTAVRREKEESLAARRQASVRSSLQRRAIIVNSKGSGTSSTVAAQVDDWAETLRFVPLPEDGSEL